jgi:hypothetical protein
LAVRASFAGAIAGQNESASKITPAQIGQALMLAQEFKPQRTFDPAEFDQGPGS